MKIRRIQRQLFRSDLDGTEDLDWVDGPLQIRCDEIVFCMVAHTESETVLMKFGEMPTYGESYETVDLSETTPWSSLVGREIESIQPSPHGFNIFIADKAVSVFYYSADDVSDSVLVRISAKKKFLGYDTRRGRADYEP